MAGEEGREGRWQEREERQGERDLLIEGGDSIISCLDVEFGLLGATNGVGVLLRFDGQLVAELLDLKVFVQDGLQHQTISAGRH